MSLFDEIQLQLSDPKTRFQLPSSVLVGLSPSIDDIKRELINCNVEEIAYYAKNVASEFYSYAKNWHLIHLDRQRLKSHQHALLHELLVRAHSAELMLQIEGFKGFESRDDLERFLKNSPRRYLNAIQAESIYKAHVDDKIGSREEQSEIIDENTYRLVKERDYRNDQFLTGKIVLKAGASFSLPNLEQQNTNRLNETISVVKALEEIARSQDKIFVMITLTAAPQYHPSPTTYDPKLNDRDWNYRSVKEGHENISTNFRKVTRRLNKRLKFSTDEPINNTKYSSNSNVFGLRVVEPHKDGSPHWHVLLFIAPEHINLLKRIVSSVFNWSDKAWDIVVQDKDGAKSASAASYLTKYLMKTYAYSDSSQLGDTNHSHSSYEEPFERKSDKVMMWRKALGLRAYEKIGVRGRLGKYRKFRSLFDLTNLEKNRDIAALLPVGFLTTIQAAVEGKFSLEFNHHNKDFMVLNDISISKFYDFLMSESEFEFEKITTSIGERIIFRAPKMTLLLSHNSLIVDAE